jgi:hypothetical protein
MAEKSIKQFIGEVKAALAAYGDDGIHSMQVKDAQGNVIKQTEHWIDESTFLKAERLRRLATQKDERTSNGYNRK